MRINIHTEYFVEEYIDDYGWVKARTFTQTEGEAGWANNSARQLCMDSKHKTRVIKLVSYTELVTVYDPG